MSGGVIEPLMTGVAESSCLRTFGVAFDAQQDLGSGGSDISLALVGLGPSRWEAKTSSKVFPSTPPLGSPLLVKGCGVPLLILFIGMEAFT